MPGDRFTMPITFKLLDEVKQKKIHVQTTQPENTELINAFAKIEGTLKSNIANNKNDIDVYKYAEDRVRRQIDDLSINLVAKPKPTIYTETKSSESRTYPTTPSVSDYGSLPPIPGRSSVSSTVESLRSVSSSFSASSKTSTEASWKGANYYFLDSDQQERLDKLHREGTIKRGGPIGIKDPTGSRLLTADALLKGGYITSEAMPTSPDSHTRPKNG